MSDCEIDIVALSEYVTISRAEVCLDEAAKACSQGHYQRCIRLVHLETCSKTIDRREEIFSSDTSAHKICSIGFTTQCNNQRRTCRCHALIEVVAQPDPRVSNREVAKKLNKTKRCRFGFSV